MRKHFIDNLRWLCVLLLFPFHTSMIYNGFGDNFYIRGGTVPVLSNFMLTCSSWFMPLMFTIAGISTYYALEKRTGRQYFKERFFKLFVPLVAGLLLVIPMQTYFAERFHNGYTGGYFEQYIWFILYLFIFSMLALPIILWYQKRSRKLPVEKLTIPALLPLFVIASVMSFVGDFGGKSLGYFFTFFILGYFVLSSERIQLRLAKNRWILLGALVLLTPANVILLTTPHGGGSALPGLLNDLTGWIGILTFLGLGRQYLNKTSRLAAFFSEASFTIYILHQTILVAAAFYVFKLTFFVPLQVAMIIIGSFVATIGVYEIFKRISVMRFLFGIKKPERRLK